MAGVIHFSGSSEAKLYLFGGSGEVSFGGSALIASTHWVYPRPVFYQISGSGGVLFQGAVATATYRYPLAITLPVRWGVEADYVRTMSIRWDTIRGRSFYYRVEGECVPSPTCGFEPVNPDTGESPAGSRPIHHVIATSVAEVCAILKSRGDTFRATSIRRVGPMFREDGDDGSESETLDEQFCHLPECLDFCVGATPTVRAGMRITVQDTFDTYEGTGGVLFWGSNESMGRVYTGSGQVAFAGSADLSADVFAIAGSGGVAFSGSGETESSVYSYEGSGGLELGGTTGPVVSSAFTFTGSGQVAFDGATGAPGYLQIVLGSGSVILAGSATVNPVQPIYRAGDPIGHEFDDSFNDDFHIALFPPIAPDHLIEGGVTFSGSSADTASSFFAWSGDGGIQFDGSATLVSSSHHFEGSGSVTWGGTAVAVSSFIHGDAGGAVTWYGMAFSQIVFLYTPEGSLSLGGEAQVTSPSFVYDAQGSVHFTGSGEIAGTDLGEFTVTFACEPGLMSTEALHATPVLARTLAADPSQLILACGCEVPRTLTLHHNLFQDNPLTAFMARNGFVVESPHAVLLRHDPVTTTWRWGTSYGRAGVTDRWDIAFALKCDRAASLWIFTFRISRRGSPLNDAQSIGRWLFRPRDLCPGGLMASAFSLHPITGQASLQTPYGHVYQDDLKLFKSSAWRQRVLTVEISTDQTPQTQLFDIRPIIPAATA